MLQLQKQPAADHIHENKLLRYELARLTQANEAMLKQIHQLSHSQLHVQG